jgi:hypothetical protein
MYVPRLDLSRGCVTLGLQVDHLGRLLAGRTDNFTVGCALIFC